MIGKRIAFVPARCGSKSIPFKNIKLFCGQPLIFWCLQALSLSKQIDEIYVATDCQKIEDVVKSFGLEKVQIYRRSDKNAGDQSSTESVMLEFINAGLYSFSDTDLFILSQLTNPFTTSDDYDKAIDKLKSSDTDSIISGALIKRFFWNKETATAYNYDYMNRPRRQDFDGVILENGAFYINSIANIKKYGNRLSGNIKIHEMPEHTQTELDEPHDWLIAEALFRHYHQKQIHTASLPKLNIKIVISDIDGVLTDAGMYYSEFGDELKKFNTRDGMGFELLRNTGLKTGIITSENTKIVENRAKKLKVDYLYQSMKYGGKLAAINEMCKLEQIDISEVAYIGDDLNCSAALSAVGFAACPSDAVEIIKSIPNIVQLNNQGGQGVFREFAELILKRNA